MKSIAQTVVFFAVVGLLSGCNKSAESPAASASAESAVATAPSMLADISGVWRATDGTMVSIVFDDRKLRLLFGADVIPVQVGAIDEANHTTNLKVTLLDGKPGIWTVSQVFSSADKEAFSLQLTLHDGTQDQLSFVRKISNDDLSVIAAAESKVHAGSLSEAMDKPQEQTSNSDANSSAASNQSANAATADLAAWAPSFDCAKASTGPERLICSSKELSAADVALTQIYRAARSSSADKAWLTEQQVAWRKNVRDACSDVQCMLVAYEQRISDLK